MRFVNLCTNLQESNLTYVNSISSIGWSYTLMIHGINAWRQKKYIYIGIHWVHESTLHADITPLNCLGCVSLRKSNLVINLKSKNAFCVCFLNWLMQNLLDHFGLKEPKNPLWARIAGFHMTSLNFKFQNYWSSWDFTFMMYKSS